MIKLNEQNIAHRPQQSGNAAMLIAVIILSENEIVRTGCLENMICEKDTCHFYVHKFIYLSIFKSI